jgi:hypothetical protein
MDYAEAEKGRLTRDLRGFLGYPETELQKDKKIWTVEEETM